MSAGVRVINRCIEIFFIFLTAAVIVINIFFSHGDYPLKKNYIFPCWCLMLAGLAVVFAVMSVFSSGMKRHFFSRRINKILGLTVLSMVLFILQCVVFQNILFVTQTWDPWNIISPSMDIAWGDKSNLESLNFYFSVYPNNNLLLCLYSLILRFAGAAGITDVIGSVSILVVVQCILCTMTGALMFMIILDMTDSGAAAMTGWILYAALTGMSGWNMVPYTDMTGIIFPVLILRLYQMMRNGRHMIIKMFLFITAAFWGTKLKVTSSIVVIAIVITELISFISARDKAVKLKKALMPVVVSAVLLPAFTFLFNEAVRSTGLDIDPDRSVGMMHYLMMGMNPYNHGVWYAPDVDLSFAYADRQERVSAQIQVITGRLRTYGLSGFIDHLRIKSLIVFNDGSFAWGREGGFFNWIFPDRSKFSPVIRSFYYGSREYYTGSVQQALWLAVLSLCPWIGLKRKDRTETSVMISIIGIIIFCLLFEARARYLILYVPFFIIGASVCLNGITERVAAVFHDFDRSRSRSLTFKQNS